MFEQPTLFFRYLRKRNLGSVYAGDVLQQQWIVYEIHDGIPSGQKTVWRNVPIVEEPIQQQTDGES